MKLCLDCGLPKSFKGKYCKRCGYKHRIRPSGLKYNLVKQNPTKFKKGQIPWNKGVRGKFNGNSRDGLHDWVERNLGKAKNRKCEHCRGNKNMELSNRSGKYKKDLKDWQWLCKKCHCKYDFDNFGARKVFYR